jgi:hypothetical protein
MHGEADMVIGSRLHAGSQSQFRKRNRWGNRLVRSTLNSIFGVRLTDILSGYRAFNRKFVKSLPLFGGGFEIETELTIKAVERGYRLLEVPIDLSHRLEGSHSKIQFVRDGFIIINTTLALFRDYKPLTFFGGAGIVLALLSLAAGAVSFFDLSGLSPSLRTLTFVVAVGLFFCSLLLLTAGLILHSIARRSQEFEYQMRVLSDEFRRAYKTGSTQNGVDGTH